MPTTCTASGAILKGDAVCLIGYGGGQPTVERATPANLAKYKTVLGVAEANKDGFGNVSVRVAGEVADQSITGLRTAAAGGPPTGTLVVTDIYVAGGADADTCRLRHIYQ